MNRRSVLRWLGLAPVAAPAAVAAASAPALPPINYSALEAGVNRRLVDPVIADVRDDVARLSAAERRLMEAERNIRVMSDAAVVQDMTANGGLTHPFTFDGETFRVSSSVVPRAAG